MDGREYFTNGSIAALQEGCLHGPKPDFKRRMTTENTEFTEIKAEFFSTPLAGLGECALEFFWHRVDNGGKCNRDGFVTQGSNIRK